MAESENRTTYDIITVDWNEKQTAFWKYFIDKNCPTANIITIPDKRPIKWSKFSSKLNCLLYEHKHPNRVMYMDTDCIVTENLEILFEYMEDQDYQLGLSRDFLSKMCPFKGGHAKDKKTMQLVKQQMGVKNLPPHYSSGMMLFREIDLKELYDKWMLLFGHPLLVKLWGGIAIMEEIALSFALKGFGYREWHLPREVHGNICSGFDFGKADEPMVIHYHKPYRFAHSKLGKFLEEGPSLR